MNILLIILVILLAIGILWLNFKMEKEKKRNRILLSFVAGTIRAISDYRSTTDNEEVPDQNQTLPIPYENIMENIDCEFSKDFWMEPYKKWLMTDRNIFNDSKYADDGFNFIYYDFFDRRLREWHSAELMSEKKKEYISDDIEITEDNVGELEGEIAMLKDLMKGNLSIESFTPENIDEKLLIMFSHIKPEKREEAKQEILKQMHL
jgi:hypothetical protein